MPKVKSVLDNDSEHQLGDKIQIGAVISKKYYKMRLVRLL